MCNNYMIQRRVALARAKALFEGGASIDHVLGEAWNAGFIEGDLYTPAESEAEEEFDRRLDEMNRELESGV